MDSSCKNNVEFGEFSNEMMFIVLAKRPDLFLETYHRLIDQIDTAYLNFELRSPIHDLIPLDSIIVEIENLDFDKNTKEILLNELKKGVW